MESFAVRKLRELGWAVSANESKEAVTPTLQCEGRGLLGWMDGWPCPCPFSSLPMLNKDLLSAPRLGRECLSGPKAEEMK